MQNFSSTIAQLEAATENLKRIQQELTSVFQLVPDLEALKQEFGQAAQRGDMVTAQACFERVQQRVQEAQEAMARIDQLIG